MRLSRRAAVALLPVALSACVFGRRTRTAGAADSATLEVRNDYVGPVDVYVVRGGAVQATRLGQVAANRVQRFRLDPNVLGGTSSVSFVASPPVAAQAREHGVDRGARG